MNATSLERHQVRHRSPNTMPIHPSSHADKHKIIQILVNLIRKRQASLRRVGAKRQTTGPSAFTMAKVQSKISTSDNGVGIAPENLSRIFSHGFTTRKDGHGFGLHKRRAFGQGDGRPIACYQPRPRSKALFSSSNCLCPSKRTNNPGQTRLK